MTRNDARGTYRKLTEKIKREKELENEVSRLESALKSSREEVESLREKNKTMEAAADERVATAVEEAVKQVTEQFTKELSNAYLEIARLNAIVNKNSSNSSKPSSTNGNKDIPNSRKKSGKPRGGQRGHVGRRLGLPENIELLEQQGIVERRVIDNTNGSSNFVSRFTIDVEVKVIITEHRYANPQDIPDGLLNEVSYGDSIKATALLLMTEGMIADKRLSGIISGLTHGVVNISTATLCNIESQFAQKLDKSGEIEAIEQDLLNGKVMHTDDTSARSTERIVYPNANESDGTPIYEQSEKNSFRITIRTYSNENSTLYTVNPKKDKAGVDRDGILPKYDGTLSHDHESKFYNYGSGHGTCCEHLCRDLQGLQDLKNCAWAGEMRSFMYGMNEYKKNDQESGINFCDPKQLVFFESEYDRIVNQGRIIIGQMQADDWGFSDFNAMLKRLEAYKDSYMRFIRDYDVPFTNNLAERDLRPEKTKQKVSGPYRSWKGAEVRAKNNGFISTIKKRGKELFSSITQVFKGKPVLKPAPQ